MKYSELNNKVGGVLTELVMSIGAIPLVLALLVVGFVAGALIV